MATAPGALTPSRFVEPDPTSEVMAIQMGPSHPASHGTVKFNLRLDGETIVDVDVEIGYLHRGFEKMCEQGTWNHCFPYADRLNYASPLLNNVGFALAVEKLAGVEVPERCQYIRVIAGEISRITDHLTCLGMAANELGAISAGFYMLEAREFLYDLVEAITGARLTVTYCRLGGVVKDLPADMAERTAVALRNVRRVLADCDRLLSRNRIFVDRMAGIGAIGREEAISWGLTGPLLRATGVPYDVRKAEPYLVYDRMDFDVPTGTTGDNYDRFMVRFAEMHQSMRIIEQALAQIPDGPIAVADPRWVLPPKREVYGSIEGLMNHFKLVIEGQKVPAGEVYVATEGGNGELGFYLVSDGSGRPYRVRVRPPCFYGMAALGDMLRGRMVADVITTFGQINMIGGECDH
ncbi:MAG TPA: NADH dehydrogenase (quinone) subunit D [Candidatus Binatia bacterium]|jgi:NADH-quinone oxidoreductase subunit D|nr:NADH dehydrogenase (quinone) subunit D [Candidatus Binatia bacterium]